MDNMFSAIDIYCERTGPELFSEPLNLLTNLCFIIAGFLILVSEPKKKMELHKFALGGLTILIGIGSGLFHSFANGWSQLTDVVPIGVFVLYFIYFYTSKAAGLNKAGVAAVYAVLIVSSYLFVTGLGAGFAGGSVSYFGVLVTLWVLAGVDRKILRSQHLTKAAAIFSFSLIFRSIDERFCDVNPYGFHLFWHILNAAVLYCASLTAVRTKK